MRTRFRSLKLVVLMICAPAAASSGPGAPAPETRAALTALAASDLRLARIGFALARANLALCDETMPATGLVVHARAQYPAELRPALDQVLGFPAPLAVEGVVLGGSAAAAGVSAGDGIEALDGVPPAPTTEHRASALRDGFEARLVTLPAEAPVALGLVRETGHRQVELAPLAACRSRFELVTGGGSDAHSDGVLIQADDGLLAMDDEGVAVILAHELAHNILHHRRRLEAAHVGKGLGGEFGRSRRLNRAAELEADRLSVHLLYNAGIDPLAAARFWRGAGRRLDAGLFRSRVYPSAEARARALEAEAATIPPAAPRPERPALLDNRDRPLQ